MFKVLSAYWNLLFPNFCAFCASPIRIKLDLCDNCTKRQQQFVYPKENYKLLTKFLQIQEYQVNLVQAVSLYFFVKNTPVQALIHQVKYAGNLYQAHTWGKLLADNFNNLNIDGIIPVPLHPKRYKERGYNQSNEIARGIAKKIKIPLLNKIVKRIKYTDSQTLNNKDKYKRKENIKGAFHIDLNKKNILVKFQHILLVDDVITTGSTIRELIRTLISSYPNLQISIAVVAATEGWLEQVSNI